MNESYKGALWPLGTTVQIKKPHMHASYKGEVISVDKKTGIHRVHINHSNEDIKYWEVEVFGDLLKAISYVPKGKS